MKQPIARVAEGWEKQTGQEKLQCQAGPSVGRGVSGAEVTETEAFLVWATRGR